MILPNIFKKKKKEEKPKKEKVSQEVKVEPKKEGLSAKSFEAKKEPIFAGYGILKTPQITEKATDLVEKNQYTFKVWPRANKIEVKKTIENLYGVDVISVRIINVPQKQRRLGKISGWRKGYKKAIVEIKKGQKIEVLPR